MGGCQSAKQLQTEMASPVARDTILGYLPGWPLTVTHPATAKIANVPSPYQGWWVLMVSRLLQAFYLVPVLVGCRPSQPCGDSGLCFSVASPTRMRIGFSPSAIVFADLDADGMGDLVAASSDRGTLTVIWGGITGFDGTAIAWSIDADISDVVVADLDADGHLDIAAALPGFDTVAVLRGRGHRSYAEIEHHATGPVPRALVAVDLDDAAPPELVTANLDGGSVSVLRGLTAAVPVRVGSGPRGVVAGDFDSDGDNDLAIALADDNAVQILLGDGSGDLLAGPRHIVGNAPYALVAADLDGDGGLDIAAANALDDTVSVLWGDGTGDLRARSTWPTLSAPEELVVVQRQDELPMLGVLSRATSTVQFVDPRDGAAFGGATKDRASAIVADGFGSLLYASDMAGQVGNMVPGTGLRLMPMWTGPQVSRAWPIDLEGDNIEELIVVEPGDDFGTLRLWRNGPASATSVTTGLTEGARGATSGELTGDGRRDVAVWSSEALVVLVQQPNKSLLAPSGPSAFVEQIQDVVLGDVDGDGARELLVLSGNEAESSRLQGFSVDSSGALHLVADIPLDAIVNVLRVVKGGGDGRTDLIMGDDHGALFYLEDLGLPLRLLELDASARLGDIALGDVDGDGGLNAVYCSDGGMFHAPDLLGINPIVQTRVSHNPCETLELCDLNGDGALDLLTLTIDRNLDPDRALFTPWVYGASGWTPGGAQSIIAPIPASLQFVHLDADGISDILLTGLAVSGAEAMRGVLGPALVEVEGPRLDDALRFRFGDLDGDGASDLIGFSRNLAVALTDRDGGFGPLFTFDQAVAFGSSDAVVQDVVAADFDGNGADELMVAVKSQDDVAARLLYLTIGSESELTRKDLGLLQHKNVALHYADLDGDKNLDLIALGGGAQLDSFVVAGDGRGNFAVPHMASVRSPAPVLRTLLFDMDGDGQLDVLASTDAGAVLFRGMGGDSFEAGRYWTTVHGQSHLPGDYDSDGLVDLAVLNDGELRLLLGVGSDYDAHVALNSVSAIARADLNGDGRLELLAAGDLSPPMVGTKLLHVGHSSDHEVTFYDFELPAGLARALSVNDLDGDGNAELVWIEAQGVTVVRQEP